MHQFLGPGTPFIKEGKIGMEKSVGKCRDFCYMKVFLPEMQNVRFLCSAPSTFSAQPLNTKNVQDDLSVQKVVFVSHLRNFPVAKFLVHDGGDIAYSGIGLSYRHASLCSLVSRYDNPVLESAISPSQGPRIWPLFSGPDHSWLPKIRNFIVEQLNKT